MKAIYIIIFTILLLGFNQAQARTFKMATLAPNGSTWMKEIQKAADEISKKTNGRVKFKFYGGGIMGGANNVLKKIRINQLHGGAFTSGELSDVYQDMLIYNLPFQFRNYDEVEYVRSKMDGILEQGMEKNGMIILGMSSGGFAYLMSDTPITAVDQLRNKKVWLPEGDVIIQTTYENIGIAAIPLSLADVYTGLQTGMIDTIGTSPIGAIAFQWHTRVKYATDLPLVYITGVLAIDKNAFNSIKKDDQVIVSTEMHEAMTRLNEINKEDDKEARLALEKQGITFVTITPKEWKHAQDIAQQSISDLREKGIYTSGMYHQLQEYLNEYRSKNGTISNAKK